jgi:hypothetical protein
MIETGVINLEGDSKVALVFGQMNEPPGARARVALTGLTIAEYFRDEEGQDVLLFIDNIFRFTQAGSEVSALLGRIPSAVGYQPTLSTDMGGMLVPFNLCAGLCLLNFGPHRGLKGQGRKALFYTTTYIFYTLPKGMVVGDVA